MDSQPSLPENVKNTVRYELHLSRLPDKNVIENYMERIKSIWKDIPDKFNLNADEKQAFICRGSYDVNQNIEREWLIIYALYDLSKFDRDLVISVEDNDGQILLITAAEVIPKWLESIKSNNRVFIHQGMLHIIPELVNLKDLQKNYGCSTIGQAAACFIRDMNTTDHHNQHPSESGSSSQQQERQQQRQNPNNRDIRCKTLADKPIQAAIEEQLSGMPDQRAWLSLKFKQLDDILSGQEGMDDKEQLQKKFSQDISLASVMAMDEEDLNISPISSRTSSSSNARSSPSSSRSSSSSSWLTEHEDD